MFEEYNICPYPGLRSFNEEESIYFKGRDKQVEELIKLLQKNKFLMVTGASGDGKSSLIFGGLLPNAKAGFFKAKYNNWKIVQFRPERHPLLNLATSISTAFDIENISAVETEISRGFSSLTDLYTNSKFYIDNSKSSKEEIDKKEGANLIIIADQFEEFFTNPENFFKGAPTQEAQITVNLLLETARIALSKDLPIFVVFTMRSDFIGQCASFRGLPEYIGFSQFFVPRLKRKDLQQVIEEPAILSGNRITRRLTERLIYDLEEGIDQLPILQHSLNQIWHAADSGNEEMDLFHYAMVGGMPAEELPEEEISRFNKWFASLPDQKQKLYENCNLQKIIDIHADLLYLTAWEYYNEKNPKNPLSKEEAKIIIALTFASLTKIDESRAVRNRMTLGEITRIINKDSVTEKVVADVINYFRAPGNTFIHPFIEEDKPETEILTGDVVLDITHEALIRNWIRLKKWAWKEFEYYETLQDLLKQLNRWLENNKSKNFLLPIGPLMYFEKWKEDCRPSTAWINRYNDESQDPEENLKNSGKVLEDINDFLKQSSRNVIVSKTVTKYGPRRILSAITLIVVLFLSSFYFIDAEKKQNKNVTQTIASQGQKMVLSKEAGDFAKGMFLMTSEMNEPGSIMKALNSFGTEMNRVRTANIAYGFYNGLDRHYKGSLKGQLSQQIIEDLKVVIDDTLNTEDNLEQYSIFLATLSFDQFFNPSTHIDSIRDEALENLFPYMVSLIDDKKDVGESNWFQRNFDHLLMLNIHNKQLKELTQLISPIESTSAKDNFQHFFPIGKEVNMGRNGNISHNGGYQIMASLYAAQGNVPKTKQCLDSLLKYNPNYIHPRSFSGEFNILEYFFRFNHVNEADQIAEYIAEIRSIPKYEVYKELTVRSGRVQDTYFAFYYFHPGYVSLNTFMTTESSYEKMFDLYGKSINQLPEGDEKYYEHSLALKARANFTHHYKVQKQLPTNTESYYALLDKAFIAYSKISEAYLSGTVRFQYRYYTDGVRTTEQSRETIFKYPDHIGYGYHARRYHSSLFLSYLLKKNLFNKTYQSLEEINLINDWLSNYLEISPGINTIYNVEIETNVLVELESTVRSNAASEEFDFNLINLLLANRSFDVGELHDGFSYAKAIEMETLPLTANRWEYLNFTAIYNEVWQLALNLALNDHDEEAFTLVQTFPDANHKASVYSKLAQFIYGTSNKEKAFIYLDSAFSEREKVDEGSLGQFDYRFEMLKVLSEVGGESMNKYAMDILTEMIEFKKPGGVIELVSGIADEGNFYNAVEAIPNNMPMSNELLSYSVILAEGAKNQNRHKDPKYKGFWESWDHFRDYIVFLENF